MESQQCNYLNMSEPQRCPFLNGREYLTCRVALRVRRGTKCVFSKENLLVVVTVLPLSGLLSNAWLGEEDHRQRSVVLL